MRYKLLSIENKSVINIGDYVQALAASQFYPHVDGFVNREELSDYSGDECKVIMNGWYMHNPTHWPPSGKIHPLFVALHINKLAAQQMLNSTGVEYLKQHEPIGCRDYYTRDMLRDRGVDAYFSGCLTLTLGKKFKSRNESGKVYFVDPTIPSDIGIIEIMKDMMAFILHFPTVRKISRKLITSHYIIKNILRCSRFFRFYSTVFSKDTLTNAEFVNQENSSYASLDNEERLVKAEELVRQYAEARFVVTSRIHCALPCLGVETPVYFTCSEKIDEVSSCRFGGLINLFNKVYVSQKGLNCDFEYQGKLSRHNIVKNKEMWRPIAKELEKKCSEFTPPLWVILFNNQEEDVLLSFNHILSYYERRAA